MDTATAILIEGVSKYYKLGSISSGTLSSDLDRWWARRRGKPDPLLKIGEIERDNQGGEYIWALHDVSLEVKQGEVMGLIGGNGAGKSTLLKILSRVTAPTAGQIKVKGRIASLLEVGTGFHPELTGRQNIYLNGSILGMRKAEIARKFDEIVAFSQIDQFIDTPVKRYSSGMYVRLAFAVASHLEPEILLVDEVLAVGDYAFQKKCLTKMGTMSDEGRTVLLVSHNMTSISNLCGQVALLHKGEVEKIGPANEVISEYISSSGEEGGERIWNDINDAPGNESVKLSAVRVLCGHDQPTAEIPIDKDFVIEIDFVNLRPNARLNASVHIKDSLGAYVLASGNTPSACLTPDPWFDSPFPVGRFSSRCCIPGNLLNDGRYTVNVIILSNVTHIEARCDDAISFNMLDTSSMRQEYQGKWIGVIRPKLHWSTYYLGEMN